MFRQGIAACNVRAYRTGRIALRIACAEIVLGWYLSRDGRKSLIGYLGYFGG